MKNILLILSYLSYGRNEKIIKKILRPIYIYINLT